MWTPSDWAPMLHKMASDVFRNCVIAILLTCFTGILLPDTGNASKHPCTIANGRRALEEADSLGTWDALYASYKKFGHCDEGAIGEGYSESVARILADHWSSLPRFDQLAGEDAPFREFVIRHLDATLNAQDVERIRAKATTHCPPGLRKTCTDLIKQADYALRQASSR
jgi:hypothetical protein